MVISPTLVSGVISSSMIRHAVQFGCNVEIIETAGVTAS